MLWYLSSLNISCFSQRSIGIPITWLAYSFCCFRMKLLTSDVQHIAWTFSFMSLYRKSPSSSQIFLNPPLIILLRRLRYVTSNFSNWPIITHQFWHGYVCCGQNYSETWLWFAIYIRWLIYHTICKRWLILMSPVLGSF